MSEGPRIQLTADKAINYAFQQNAIPVIKELRFINDSIDRVDIRVRVTTEPAFAQTADLRLQSVDALAEVNVTQVDLKLSHDYLAELNEKVSGWLKVEIFTGENLICSQTEAVSLLARNEWCGLVALPEILAAFILPNDSAVMTVLSRAAELLRLHTGQSAFNGYQDKSRKRAWEQIAAIYKSLSELGIRYIGAPASFETTGQKVRTPSDILAQRFGNCLDLSLLFAACCEQVGLHPLIVMHEGHAYAGCWLEDRTLSDPSSDDLQYLRKLAADELLTVFEATLLTGEKAGTLKDAEFLAKPHLETKLPFRLALDVRRSRVARIHPLPIPGQKQAVIIGGSPKEDAGNDQGIGDRAVSEPLPVTPAGIPKIANRIDQWKSRLLDLTLRNRLLNFRETKSTIRILSASPEHVEDGLAADQELKLHPKPKIMGEDDPRNRASYSKQQRLDALEEHLRDELKHGRLHTDLDPNEHSVRLTELYRAARTSIDENGTNTLFAAVGSLEWRETEHGDRTFTAPLLLIPVELKRKSVIEGFSLKRIDEEPRLNVTLMEMLRQHFHKEVPGLEPLPEDQSGIDVGRVFQIFREAVRDMPGWEVKAEIWLGQFSFTKFLLWKDLADRLENLTQNRIVNHLVKQAGTPYPHVPGDIRPQELDDKYHPRDVFCPRSADSSQLAAVMAAADGQDFVLEGPPGTGKSQTIANIIAHCIASGKRVLFVAEKRAALDVVYRRLKEEGLEPFCLELHSNKTGKADVVAQFDRSLKFVFEDESWRWKQRVDDLEVARASLNNYARALHKRHACGLSAYHCLDYLLPRKDEVTVRLDSWPDIHATSVETLEKARALARLIQQRSRVLIPLADHPLGLLGCDDWSPVWAERALEHVGQLAASSKATSEIVKELCTWIRFPASQVSRTQLQSLQKLVEDLRSPEPVGPQFATAPWIQLERNLESWIGLSRERIELRSNLRGVFKTTEQSGSASVCETWSAEECARVLQCLRDCECATQDAIEATRPLLKWIAFPRAVVSRIELIRLISFTDCLRSSVPVAEQFATQRWQEWVADLDRWIALVKERIELRAALVGYDEVKLLGLDLDSLSQKWKTAQSTWFIPKWFLIRGVRQKLGSSHSGLSQPAAADIAMLLKAATRLKSVTGTLSESLPKAEAVLGLIWNHGEPELDHLTQVRSWGSILHERMTELAGEDGPWLSSVRSLLATLFRDGTSSYDGTSPVGKMLTRFREAITQFDQTYDTLAAAANIDRKPIDDSANHLSCVEATVQHLLKWLPRLRAINTTLLTDRSSGEGCLGSIWANGEPVPEAIERARDWGRILHPDIQACAGDNLAWLAELRGLLATLFSEGLAAYSEKTVIGSRLRRFDADLKQCTVAYEDLAKELRLNRVGIDSASDYLGSIQLLCQRIPTAWSQIREWCYWQKVRNEALSMNLGAVIEKLEAPGGELLDIPLMFERSFRRALLFASVEKEPALREFFGREHNERIERFRELDQQVAQLTRDLIRARLATGIPRDQGHEDVPKTEIGLLRREITKKTRHIPVRQLLGRIPHLLPKLKPCVLMSPLSVAQYLEPSHEMFDLVIFDEASQIPVWDAIGAIARGKQLVVVGDPKQLPPTSFFNSSDDDAEDMAAEEHKDLESILDELMTNGLRHKRLQWHYRSRHEGLITFSNRQYYQNDLLTFPSPETGMGGVRFKHLPDARYDKGKSRTNMGEAVALVQELVSRLKDPDSPRRSYGVVTFSQAQQKLVENLLDEERRKFPEIEVHFGDEPPVEGEPVFVKNLESVQGDERDIIFFSICYGPDEIGRVSMNFGPLNRDGGERRLNVAITRAKHEVMVFSGLRPDQIDLSKTRARGVRDLKYFLDYAQRGPVALTAATSVSGDAEPDSEFEEMVAAKLRANGFEVHHQVGCSGYRVDLGVVDPSKPGRYLLGVECDGATYHRAATARDRDKLRQNVLEGLGWTLYRIWSTDWWHDNEAEVQKLLTFIKEIPQSE